MNRGYVVKFNREKGWGFIRSDHYDSDLFFHVSNLAHAQTVEVGKTVKFDLQNTQRGLAAINIEAFSVPISAQARFLIVSVLLILTLWSAANFALQMNPLFVNYLLAVNMTAFLLFGYDKFIAGGKKQRIPEAILHSLSLLGGWLGSAIGMGLFRHKTRKSSFLIRHWGIFFVFVGAIFLFTMI